MNVLDLAIWTSVTTGVYLLVRWVHQRWRRSWTTPFLVGPSLLILVLLASGSSYAQYKSGGGWLVRMLGPATVAFAIPIYEQRAVVKAHWRALLAGSVVASVAGMVSSHVWSTLFSLPEALRRSLLPYSTSTPFAMVVSSEIGGIPELTALFVVVTGLVGAVIGPGLVRRFGLRSPAARGALFGAGAHAVGTARAMEMGPEEGSVSALVMVAVGVIHVLAAPWVAVLLR